MASPALNDSDLELLSAYLDAQLSPAEQAAIEARLAADPRLQAELDGLRATVAVLRAVERLPVPRNFTLDAARYGRPARRSVLDVLAGLGMPVLSGAGALAALLLIFGLFTLSRGGLSAPQAAMAPAAVVQEEAAAEAGPAADFIPAPVEDSAAFEAEMAEEAPAEEMAEEDVAEEAALEADIFAAEEAAPASEEAAPEIFSDEAASEPVEDPEAFLDTDEQSGLGGGAGEAADRAAPATPTPPLEPTLLPTAEAPPSTAVPGANAGFIVGAASLSLGLVIGLLAGLGLLLRLMGYGTG